MKKFMCMVCVLFSFVIVYKKWNARSLIGGMMSTVEITVPHVRITEVGVIGMTEDHNIIVYVPNENLVVVQRTKD